MFENSRRRYGYRRVHLELRGAGVVVSAKRVMRLMTGTGSCPCPGARGATPRTGARSARHPSSTRTAAATTGGRNGYASARATG
ncbi:IS3 family transposase [Bifidobacterium bifidum]|uniref:IS3 family transposase n=1 Tax=Bifidobacterium bifidum TaxID=1681 RepID=UPI003D033988